jgi:hypothetical protein
MLFVLQAVARADIDEFDALKGMLISECPQSLSASAVPGQ